MSVRRANRPELLAPGGSIEAIEAAVQHGADAVYLGVGSLNARVRARNLTAAQLPGVVGFCHAAGVRVHVALNVPLQPATVSDAASTLAEAWAAGADAVIVRDAALMRAARELCPGLAIHASTQAGVQTPASARRARENGCDRVILARESSLADVQRIRGAVPEVEVETFVYGALCFAVSGQCLLGEAVGGRSGNYGACSQPCRLPYFDATGKPLGYVFSMRDLDLTARIPELVEAGVASLKIEGRLKSPAWVGCVVRWLRRALDRDPPGLTADEARQFEAEASVLFRRPPTSAWLDGNRGYTDLVAPDASGHRGLNVPEFSVVSIRGGHALRFRTPVELSLHDGLLVGVSDPKAHDGVDSRPMPVERLLDERGRDTFRIPAGAVAQVPIRERGRVVAVAIHSSDAVRLSYERADRRMPQDVLRGEPARPRFVSIDLAAGHLGGLLRHGRLEHAFDLPLRTEPARNGGLPRDLASRLFGDAEVHAEPGLFANPSALKRARREALAAFETTAGAETADLTARVEARLRETAVFPKSDAELLAIGPAAFSRVEGFPHREVFTSAGHKFEIEPARHGTRVQYRGRR